MLRKIVGFILGFGLGFAFGVYLVQWYMLRYDYQPYYGYEQWGLLVGCLLLGVLNGKFFMEPHLWWKLNPRLRFFTVASVMWVVFSYLMQEQYEESLKIVLLPPLALITFHFAEKFFVRGRGVA